MATRSFPEVSVALCTHNGAPFIVEQLLSILGQSEPPREIVLSDDASGDDTIALVRTALSDFRADHPQCATELRVIENAAALGVVKNFEQAILACTSELISLSDQDDVWSPDRLARIRDEFARRPNLLLLHSDARLIDDAGSVIPGTLFQALEVSDQAKAAIRSGDAFTQLLRRNLVTGATVVFRRELVPAATPFPRGWVHDEWLAVIASLLGEVDVVDEALIDYRQHGMNQIGARKLSLFGKFHRMIEPGVKRNARLLARAQSLVDGLESLADRIPATALAAARRKLRHEVVRSSLSPTRIKRLVSVVRELRTGRYSEFGRGPADAVRDLIQPLRGPR